MKYFREACCPDAAAVSEACRHGASRIELCSQLETGGVTPDRETVREALRISAGTPINVLVRPRGGDFVYTEEEQEAMLADIRQCKELGVNGVVIGALLPDGNIDLAAMRRLIAEARPLQVTFHRAFDVCSSPAECLEDIIALGCDRLLSSGHGADAYAGRFTLASLVAQAAGRIIIMAGCGVRPANIDEIAAVSHAAEYHSSMLSGW